MTAKKMNCRDAGPKQDELRRAVVSDSVLCHDISNVMTTILGHVDLARTRIQAGLGGALDHLGEIEAAAKRAADLCRQYSIARTAGTEVMPRPQTVRSAVSEWTNSGVRWQRGRVLLVDDESSVRAVARQMLERIGFAVESAIDGGDALELLEQDPYRFSCVLLDINMPGMSGDACFSRLRQVRPDLPVLFSSGSSDRVLAEPLSQAPLTTFLQKPYSLDALRRELQSLLSRVSS